MSHESIKALEKIVDILGRSENLTRRQINVFEIALEGLGMVSRQRTEIVAKWKQPLIDKIAARRARQMAESGS